MIHIITGNGPGKTTRALGLALRSVGRGLQVKFIMFMKGQETGELFSSPFAIEQYGSSSFVFEPSDEHRANASKALKAALRAVKKEGIVIVDEVFDALTAELVTVDEIIELISSKSDDVELILTGRYAPKELYDLADYVTEIQCVKHPYPVSLARVGIEY